MAAGLCRAAEGARKLGRGSSGAQQRSGFTGRSLEYAVSCNIQASPAAIWTLLTTAADIPRWNTTGTSVEGAIEPGRKIKVQVPIAPKRTFNLLVSELVPGQRMVWRDGMAPMFQGVRTYTLSPRPDGSTDFAMAEVFSGLMLPMIAGSLPDFTSSFEQYAADLKREAELAIDPPEPGAAEV